MYNMLPMPEGLILSEFSPDPFSIDLRSLAKAPTLIFLNMAYNIGWSTFFSKIITNCEECYLDCLFHISSNVQYAPDA